MPYKIQEDGEDYVVINTETGMEKARHAPPDAKDKAEKQVKLLHELEHGLDGHGDQ